MPKISRPRRAPRRGTLLIAAISGRALARAAADAGLDALVADFFADTDTHAIAVAYRKLPGALSRGFQWASLARALDALAKQAPSPLLGVIYGSGFEDRPALLDQIAKRWPVLGNDAKTVAHIKSPDTFFATLDRLAIPHPATMMERPARDAGWIAKRRCGAGGSHVVPSRLQKSASDIYFQALMEGRTVSALFVADGSRSRILGFSEQWTAPAPGRLWRYGGAVRPAVLSASVEAAATESIAKATKAFGLTGLASADFIVSGNTPYLLEINPRPGATLDIFATAAKPLLRLHLDAVMDGKLPRIPSLDGAAASAVVYAPKRVIVPCNMNWPSWAADLPKPGERIDKQRPICTLLARAGTRGRAKRLVEARTASLLAKIQEWSKGEESEQEERRERNARQGTAEPQRSGRATGARPHR
ncbi:MAG: ATP-grasp domain-containing protein [Hyphomicrobiales bacterium]